MLDYKTMEVALGSKELFVRVKNYIVLQYYKAGIDLGYESNKIMEYFRNMTPKEIKSIGFKPTEHICSEIFLGYCPSIKHKRMDMCVYGRVTITENDYVKMLVKIQSEAHWQQSVDNVFLPTGYNYSRLFNYIKGRLIYDIGDDEYQSEKNNLVNTLRNMSLEELKQFNLGIHHGHYRSFDANKIWKNRMHYVTLEQLPLCDKERDKLINTLKARATFGPANSVDIESEQGCIIC